MDDLYAYEHKTIARYETETPEEAASRYVDEARREGKPVHDRTYDNYLIGVQHHRISSLTGMVKQLLRDLRKKNSE